MPESDRGPEFFETLCIFPFCFFSDAKILAETDEQLHWLKVGVGS